MNAAERSIDQQIGERFIATLNGIPEMSAEITGYETSPFPGEQPYDIVVDIKSRNATYQVFIETKKKTIYPADAKQVLWTFKRERELGFVRWGGFKLPILAAEAISESAKDLLRQERVGYFDLGGSLYLPASGFMLYVDRPVPKAMERKIRSLFSGTHAQIAHALLLYKKNKEWFGVGELADLARVSAATASETLQEFEKYNWVEAKGQGPAKERRLTQPGALLDAWVAQLPSLRLLVQHRYYIPDFAPIEATASLLERVTSTFKQFGVEYAVSFEAAAQRYAAFLTGVAQIRLRTMPAPAPDAALMQLGAKVVSVGANLVLVDARGHNELFLGREDLNGISTASPIQVYLDLLRTEGRAKELAEHLRKERIGF